MRIANDISGPVMPNSAISSSAPDPIPVSAAKIASATDILGEIGPLETRLAQTAEEVKQAQSLRYDIFYRERDRAGDWQTRATGRDVDRFDAYCDHLLVIDRSLPDDRKIVGTYRLLHGEQQRKAGQYYSENEFELAPLFATHSGKRFLEVGRSCVRPGHRSRRTMELMWQGIFAFVLRHQIDILFGCASFPGTDPAAHGATLAWLADNAVLPNDSDCPPKGAPAIALNGTNNEPLDARSAFKALPPVLKGYMRLGAKVASHAVIDESFDTMDVLVVLDMAAVNPKYLAHYKADASRFSRSGSTD